jgi:hypothetical protein
VTVAYLGCLLPECQQGDGPPGPCRQGPRCARMAPPLRPRDTAPAQSLRWLSTSKCRARMRTSIDEVGAAPRQ